MVQNLQDKVHNMNDDHLVMLTGQEKKIALKRMSEDFGLGGDAPSSQISGKHRDYSIKSEEDAENMNSDQNPNLVEDTIDKELVKQL